MKKLLATLPLLFLFAPTSFVQAEAVTYNHGATQTATSSATSISWSHTATGDNYLLVGLSFRGGAAATGVSCTYNSVSMGTALATYTSNLLFQNFVFGLSNPATGANTISCSWTHAQTTAAISNSFSGVSSVGTVQTVISTPSTRENDITATLGANDMLWQGGSCDCGSPGSNGSPNFLGTLSPTATTTAATVGNSNNFWGGTVTGTGSVTNKLYQFGGDGIAGIGVPLIGAAASSPPSILLNLLRPFFW